MTLKKIILSVAVLSAFSVSAFSFTVEDLKKYKNIDNLEKHKGNMNYSFETEFKDGFEGGKCVDLSVTGENKVKFLNHMKKKYGLIYKISRDKKIIAVDEINKVVVPFYQTLNDCKKDNSEFYLDELLKGKSKY